MNFKSKDIQLQYKGFLQTPFLWHGKGVFGLQQFTELLPKKTSIFNQHITKLPRLGKLVERFVSFSLSEDKAINILAENIQIQQNKITLGELDCIILKNKQPIHLEIVYKFYLYDSSVGNTEIEHWIGPNRKDSLIEKLTKLKEKQLPLLYSKECKEYISQINLSPEKIEQQVYFKTQLFVPLTQFGKQFSTINNNCIIGFYIYQNELAQFSDCKFFIPTKHHWLTQPHANVNWLNFNDFITKSSDFLIEKRAPLCWIKKNNGEIFKFFIVWWDS